MKCINTQEDYEIILLLRKSLYGKLNHIGQEIEEINSLIFDYGFSLMEKDNNLHLGKLLSILEEKLKILPKDIILQNGFNFPHSYRGDYECISFEKSVNVLLIDMYNDVKNSMHNIFGGYHGGEFMMGTMSKCYLSEYGCDGERFTIDSLNEMFDSRIF